MILLGLRLQEPVVGTATATAVFVILVFHANRAFHGLAAGVAHRAAGPYVYEGYDFFRLRRFRLTVSHGSFHFYEFEYRVGRQSAAT